MLGNNDNKSGLEPIIDKLGEVFAFLTIALILLLYINGHYGFIPGNVTDILGVVREIAIIGVVALSGFEFALNGKFIRLIVFLVLLVGVIVFMFFPGAIPGWVFP